MTTIATETIAWSVQGKPVKAEITLVAETFVDTESGVSGDTGRRDIRIALTYDGKTHRNVDFRALTAAEKAGAPAGAAGKIWQIGLMQNQYDIIKAAHAKVKAHPEWVKYQDSILAAGAAQVKYDAMQEQMRIQDGV